MQESNYPLLAAASLSFIAALAHVAIILGGAEWYRFFGAGEDMATMAEAGSVYPTLITAFIALCLSVMGLYALSGAGVIVRLPLLPAVLVVIACVFCLRAIVGLILPFVSSQAYIVAQGVAFWIWSSSICLVIGFAYVWGIKQAWGYWVQ
ncbi:hypothetical protein R50072_10790 [Simiduia litorea]